VDLQEDRIVALDDERVLGGDSHALCLGRHAFRGGFPIPVHLLLWNMHATGPFLPHDRSGQPSRQGGVFSASADCRSRRTRTFKMIHKTRIQGGGQHGRTLRASRCSRCWDRGTRWAASPRKRNRRERYSARQPARQGMGRSQHVPRVVGYEARSGPGSPRRSAPRPPWPYGRTRSLPRLQPRPSPHSRVSVASGRPFFGSSRCHPSRGSCRTATAGETGWGVDHPARSITLDPRHTRSVHPAHGEQPPSVKHPAPPMPRGQPIPVSYRRRATRRLIVPGPRQ